MTEEVINEYLDELLKGKTPARQIEILRHCLVFHALQHPWIDEEVQESILANIQQDGDLK